MHISEGVLSTPLLAAGAAMALAGVSVGLRGLKPEKVPQVAVVSSAFFIGSLIHLPVGPVSIHLVLNGLCGLLLGWAAFPSILVGLTLQALLFQYGGLTVLGVNTLILALPAVVGGLLFGGLVRSRSHRAAWLGGFLVGVFAIALGSLGVGLSLALTGEEFTEAAYLAVSAHLPLMVVEGIISGFCVGFLRKVKPSILGLDEEYSNNGQMREQS